ncbi:MAG TPA: ABC transporter permease [Aestuariivirgaceae bacterium]|nr:ABC transporter permease [Aestuariivirgaceae bacterium]
MSASVAAAFGLLGSTDPAFWRIVGLSLRVTLSAVAIAALVGLPLGAALALARFPGRSAILVAVNTLMGFPPILAGLLVYLLLSRSGPLGFLALLYSPAAMITAQAFLVTPIVVALSRQTIEDLWSEYEDQLRAMGSGTLRAVPTLLWDARYSLMTAVLAGFGRAAGEVGAILIVGGNIAGHTRTMTTAIALETSKGDLALAIGLGIVLITVMCLVNVTTVLLARAARFAEGWR